jgi:hypothetical protein
MIRQDDPNIYMERMACGGRTHHRTQHIDAAVKK